MLIDANQPIVMLNLILPKLFEAGMEHKNLIESCCLMHITA